MARDMTRMRASSPRVSKSGTKLPGQLRLPARPVLTTRGLKHVRVHGVFQSDDFKMGRGLLECNSSPCRHRADRRRALEHV
jgi:hypothetical protein